MGTQYVDTPDYSALYNMRSKSEGKDGAVDGGLALTQTAAKPFVGKQGELMMAGGNIAGDLVGDNLFKGSQDEFGIYDSNSKAAAAKGTKYGLKGAGTGAAIGSNKALVSATGGLSVPIGAAAGFVAGGTYGAVTGSTENKRMTGTKEGIQDRHKYRKKSNNFAVDPYAVKEGETGVGNNMLIAKKGMRITGKRYKTIKKK